MEYWRREFPDRDWEKVTCGFLNVTFVCGRLCSGDCTFSGQNTVQKSQQKLCFQFSQGVPKRRITICSTLKHYVVKETQVRKGMMCLGFFHKIWCILFFQNTMLKVLYCQFSLQCTTSYCSSVALIKLRMIPNNGKEKAGETFENCFVNLFGNTKVMTGGMCF